jgi:DNA-binding protein HU-beta
MKRSAFLAVIFGSFLFAANAGATSDSNLVAAVAASSGVTKEQARVQVDAVIEGIKAELLAGRPMTIRNFGKFYVTEMAPREVRNPRTGEKKMIEARRYPKFSSSETLKASFREYDQKQLAAGKANEDQPEVADAGEQVAKAVNE